MVDCCYLCPGVVVCTRRDLESVTTVVVIKVVVTIFVLVDTVVVTVVLLVSAAAESFTTIDPLSDAYSH